MVSEVSLLCCSQAWSPWASVHHWRKAASACPSLTVKYCCPCHLPSKTSPIPGSYSVPLISIWCPALCTEGTGCKSQAARAPAGRHHGRIHFSSWNKLPPLTGSREQLFIWSKSGCLDGSLPDRIPQLSGLGGIHQEGLELSTPAHLIACIPHSNPPLPRKGGG